MAPTLIFSSSDYNRGPFLQALAMTAVRIESLDYEGRGVVHVDGKTIFVEGALTGELVDYKSFHRKPNYEVARATQIVEASSQRVAPACEYFGVCGGCAMQHVNGAAQTAAKQRVLEDALWHLAKLQPDVVFPAIAGPAWGYRFRARLSARHVAKKGGVLIGFREKRSSYVAMMDSCKVLPPRVSALIPPLKLLLAQMSAPDRLPQIEVSVGEAAATTPQELVIVLVLRNLEPLPERDKDRLREFSDTHGVIWYLQPKGPDTATRYYPLPTEEFASEQSALSYYLPDFDIEMQFQPTEFTQVNPSINRMLVRKAMSLLDPQPGERIADLFCGIGNFTLPIARSGANVVGIEGSAGLVRRAGENAAHNQLAAKCEFKVANLFEVSETDFAELGHFDKLLIDPPREGAVAVVNALPQADAPRRIVYVSCNPATLARDAAILVHEKGYRLRGAGIASMFPHTAHVESIAYFER